MRRSSRTPLRSLLAPILFLFGGVTLGALPPTEYSSNPGLPTAALRTRINSEVGKAKQHVPGLGVEVVELGTGSSVYAYHADRSLIPASNQKLFTTAAALDYLGPSYQFETPLLVSGETDDQGNLHGDLAVRGGGDPNFSGRLDNGDSYAAFRRWAQALRRHGIRRILGDLHLADGLFDRQFVHPDWPPEQLMWWYEAPVAALSFSDNCQLLRAWGGATAGQPGIAELVPRIDGLTLSTSLTTTSQNRSHRWKVHRSAGSEVVLVSGALLRGQPPEEAWVTVEDPVAYFAAALRDALLQEGIFVVGATQVDRTLPVAPWRLIAAERRGLPITLAVTNKRSQNFYAESIFKLLGAVSCGRGSWTDGKLAIDDILEHRLGIDPTVTRVVDGSGMSRNNRTTAQQITRLLTGMFRHHSGLEFVTSLPFGGEVGGSLKDRMDEPPYRGNVFAKTGSLNGVSSLSGYAKGKSGRIYAFSILCNNGPVWRGRNAQDSIVKAIIDHG
ncbi:MAG: D-alanyl-D-alanine carboxypeptidase/D-alanyl-D-alanine-endopeptidase [Thermoanaerobaculia bacterium]|nr:D-alanyl-D-alanine carboxypeptidase/D-alanyl-D-alanine-endopeptidase [Thermoanaerobaculia bacterium]